MDWLGDVPSHWDVRRLQNVATTLFSNVDKHSNHDERPVRLCNYTDVYHNDRIHSGLDFMRATATDEEIERFRLLDGDVLITKDSEAWDDIGVPCLVEDGTGELVCGYHLALLRPASGSILGQYLHWALCSSSVASQFHVRANGVTRFGLSKRAVASVRIPVAPPDEQAAIARCLDHVTGKIERYVNAKEKLIALLEEQMHAVLHEAVTGRIDVRTGEPYPDYRPCGAEWSDLVPRQWTTRRLGSIARVFNGATPSRSQSAYWVGGTVPWLNSSKVNDGVVLTPSDYVTPRALQECPITVVPAGAVIVGLVGQGRTRGLAALLGIGTTISQNLAAVVPTGSLKGPFLRHFLSAHYAHIRELGRGGNQEALNCDLVGRLRVHIPPPVEQAAIIEYLDRSLTTLHVARERVERQVSLAKDYRLRLVTDVVTGKLDVREAAAGLDEQTTKDEISVKGRNPKSYVPQPSNAMEATQ